MIFDYGYERISSEGPSSSANWEVPAAVVHERNSKRYLNNIFLVLLPCDIHGKYQPLISVIFEERSW